MLGRRLPDGQRTAEATRNMNPSLLEKQLALQGFEELGKEVSKIVRME